MKRNPLRTWLPYTFAALVAPLIAAWPQRAQAVTTEWQGATSGTPGDGIFWSHLLNWQGDALPLAVDDVIFGAAGTGGSTIFLDANRTINSLAFDENTTLGASGNRLTLTNTTGNVSVSPGVLATINATMQGSAGLNLSGGGSLYLTNLANNWTGNISVSGTGTRLQIAYPGQPSPASRSNAFPLGQGAQTITLSNGGEFRILGSGFNLDGGTKNFVLGSGGSAINVAAGYQQMSLDDAGQIAVLGGATAPGLIKNGDGRLTITGQAFNLAANLTVNAGLLDFGNSAASTAAVAGGQPNRFTAFSGLGQLATATTTINLNGGMLVGNNGTASMIDALTINFAGGTFAAQGADHELGTRITLTTPIPAATNISFSAGTTSNILGRQAFDPATGRFPRVHGVLNGTGTLNLIGATGNAVNSRVVFEHGDQTTGNFTGTIVLNDLVALEAQPRYGSTTGAQGIGNTIGKATVDFRGWNNTLDLRDDGTGSNQDLSSGRSDYTSNNVRLNTTVDGAISRLAVTRQGTSTVNVNNVFHLNDLSFSGSQRLVVTGGSGYGTRFNTLTYSSGPRAAITPVLDLLSSKLEINGNINEVISGDGLIKRGGDNLNLSGVAALSSIDVKSGTLRLFGANGAINAGSVSGTGSISINGGVSGNAAGVLVLDNNAANTGGSVAAADNPNRIADAIPLTTRSNASLTLISLNNTAGSETVGNVTAQGGFPTFTATQTGANAAGTALTLSGLTLNNNAVVNYSGTTLGTTAGSGKVFLTGTPVTAAGAIHGVRHVTEGGADWAVYGANGFTNFTSYAPLAAAGGAQAHMQVNAATVALTGGESAQTLKLSGATAATLDTAGQLFALTDGGIISSGAGINAINGTAAGGITAGTAGAASLYVTNANTLNIGAIIANNSGGGAVTLVKSGNGTLALVNQAAPSFPADHTNTFSGGLVINGGTVSTQRVQYLGSGAITLNGGSLEINAASGPGTDNTAVAVGNNIIVNGNGNLVWDNNGETGGSGANVLWRFGSLSVNDGALFGIGGWDNDVSFNGATMSGNPVLSLNTDRGDGNNNTIIAGNLSGGSFSVEAINGTNAGRTNRLILGAGSGDNVANTYSGTIFIGRTSGANDPMVQLNKANGTTAITGDVTINGGALFWGPSATLTNNTHITENSNTAASNRFQGNSIVTSIYAATSGNDQIADTATINLLAGTLNESGRYTFERFGTLNQRNGTFNTGTGRIEVGVYNQWGGNLAFNSGGTFVSGAATLQPGAPDVGIANNFAGGPTVWEIGSGGLVLNLQNITLGNASYTNAAGGATLKLGGNLTQNFDPLNGNTVRAIQTGGGGRELARNNLIDLMGGNRTMTIDANVFQTIHGPIIQNGGLVKAGGGVLSVQPWNNNTFAGGVAVNEGIYMARGTTAFGTGAVSIANGGTAKLDGTWTFANAFTVSGQGSYIPGESGANGAREQGALISESGYNRLTGGLAIAGGATLASNSYAQPSTATPVNTSIASSGPVVGSLLHIKSNVTGTGNLTLAGGGNGIIDGGVNTTGGGLIKTGSGTWSIAGAGTYSGSTMVEAGTLAISNNNALGTTAQGTTVAGGATLAVRGGINSLEPLALRGNGVAGGIAGVLNSSGNNTMGGAINLVSTQGSLPYLRSVDGTLTLGGSVTGSEVLGLGGAGNGNVQGAAAVGGITKTGSGTWNLSATSNALGTQGVTASGGRLNVTSGLSGGSALNIAGGAVANTGVAQSVGSLNITGTGGAVHGGAGLAVGAITRAAGTAAEFTGTITTSSPAVGGWAFSGSNFAKVSGGAVVPLSAGDYTQLLAPSGSNVTPTVSAPAENTNYNYDANGYASPTFGGIAANSLRVASGVQGLANNGSGITLGSGGLMTTGTGTFNLGGTGPLSGATAADDLIIHAQRNTNLGISLIGNGSGNLVKTGAGQLNLFANSDFTGSINVSGGLLGVAGQQTAPGALGGSLTAANRAINLNNGGGLSLTTGSWDLNDFDGVTAGIQSLAINIGSGGGTLHARDGQLLINDTNGQFGGTGDLTVSGGGRIQIDQAYNFTGDTRVTGGVLRLGNTGALGSSSEQTVTMESGTTLIAGAALNQAFVFKGTEITGIGGDRQFLGPVTFSGTNRLVTVARDAVGSAGSLAFQGNISGSGTLDLYGINANGRVQFGDGVNTFTGNINLNANTALEARLPGSIGANPGDITLNFLGANSGVRIRHYLNGEYNANLNIQNNVEFQIGRHENYGSGSQQLISFNNLSVGAGTRWFNLTGDTNYWVDIEGTAAAAGNLIVNTNNPNLMLEQGITVAGTLDKRGGNVLASRGPVTANKVLIGSGIVDLRGGGTLTSTNGVELRGGTLQISQDVDGGANPNRYTGALTLGGGALRILGDTNLGTVTAVAGQTDVIYTSADQGNSQTPLVLTGFTRSAGSQINFATDFGTVGRESTTTSNPRIHLPGQADTFGTGAVGSTDIIPWARLGNEFAGYRTQTDLGVALGVFPVTNTFMRSDAADGTGAGQLRSATASTEIMRFSGTATTTLAGNATWRAIKMDGGATRTIDIGAANTLTIDRGAVIHVGGGDNRLGVAATGGKIQAGAGVSELFLTSNGAALLIGAGIQDNGAALSVMKNGGGTVLFDGTAATSANTFTGDIHLNAGLLANTLANHIPATATINFNGGRWEPRIDPGAATGGTINLGNNIVVNASSLSLGGDPALSLDNGATAANVNGTFLLGRVTINNAATWSIAGWDQMDGTFTAAAGQQHTFNSDGGIAPTIELFQGRTANVAAEGVFTFAGAMTGDAGLNVTSRGNRAGTNPSHTVLVLGGGAADTAANNFGGRLELGVTNNSSDTGAIVRLNKADGTNAIGTQGVTIGAASLRNEANEQIADTADVTINGYASSNANYGWGLNAKTETIGSLTQNGGYFGTGVSFGPNSNAAANGGSLIVSDNGGTTSGKLSILGGGGVSNDVFVVNSGGSVTAKSVEVAKYGRMVLNSAVDSILTVGSGGLTLEGTQILILDGAGTNSRIVLQGDVTTQAASVAAALSTAGEADNKLDLGGAVRTFNVADGSAGDDLAINLTVQNGGLTKAGAGTLVLGSSALFHSNALNAAAGGANTFIGDTTVAAGELHLNKAGGTNALAGANVLVGNGSGAAKLVLRASNQVVDTAAVVIAAGGVLDLQSFNASESVGNLSSAAGGVTTLGPNSALSVNVTSNTVYAGSINGGGNALAAVTKNGAGKWTLSGTSEYSGDTVVNGGTLEVNGFINGSEITVNSGGTLSGTGTVSDVVLNPGGTLAPGTSPGMLTTRNLTTTGGTYLLDINGSSPVANGLLYDTVNTRGTIDLGTGVTTLSLNLTYTPVLGDSFWPILNDGLDPIVGFFAGLPEGGLLVSGANSFQITYQANGSSTGPSSLIGGNDIALTAVVPETSSAGLLGLAALLTLRRRRAA